MSHALGWSRAFQAEWVVCAKALGHLREVLTLLFQKSLPFPADRFLCFCVSQPNTAAHLGKHGKDAPVSRRLRALGNRSSFLGRVLSRETTGSESRAAQEAGFTLESRKRAESTPLVLLDKSQVLQATSTQMPQSQPHPRGGGSWGRGFT